MKLNKKSIFKLVRNGWKGLVLASIVGIVAYFIKIWTKSSIADPLLVALILGMTLNYILGQRKGWKTGFVLAPLIFIPIGMIFYGIKNLNFVKVSTVNPYIIGLLMIVIGVYFGIILLLGRILNQKKEITYLTATGSGICGASAIAITAPIVEATSDDVSISLVSVAIAAVCGLFLLLPFMAILLGLTNQDYALFSGSVMQFTGFVKAAINTAPLLELTISPEEALALGLSVKAVRYLGLLIAIPLFASLIKKKLYLPVYLWAFLGAGIAGSIVYAKNGIFYKETLIPIVKPIYNVLWAIAMGAIGLNADVRLLLSSSGLKALVMAFSGFVAASIVFLVGILII